MTSQQDKTLGRQLELHLNDIIKDFNQVLEKYGFQKTKVVSFTVEELNSLESPSDFSKKRTTCTDDKPPICEP